jgi:hypothetical protein
MNRYEEELQKKIEAEQLPTGDELDIKAYQQVFSALKKKPETKLSGDFSDRIVFRVMEKQKRDASRDMFWLGGGIFFLVIAFVVATIMTGFKIEFGFLKDISGYTGIFVFGVAFIAMLGWLDKRLLFQRREPEM